MFIFWRWPVDSVLTRWSALVRETDRLDQLVDPRQPSGRRARRTG